VGVFDQVGSGRWRQFGLARSGVDALIRLADLPMDPPDSYDLLFEGAFNLESEYEVYSSMSPDLITNTDLLH